MELKRLTNFILIKEKDDDNDGHEDDKNKDT